VNEGERVRVDFTEAWRSLNEMSRQFMERLPHIFAALVVFLVFLFIARAAAHLIHRFAENRRKHRNLGFVLSRLAQGGIVLMGLLVALVIAVPSFEPGQLVQVLGLSTVAIGFAFRDVLQNFLAGIIILLTEPFRIGDQIKIDDFYGSVEDIQTRATTIKTFDRRLVVIPNAEFFTKSVVVTTAFDKRRIEHVIQIGYGDDIAHAKSVILAAIRRTEGVIADPPPDIKVSDFAASGISLTLRWWISPTVRVEEIETRDRVLTSVKSAMTENGIDIPYSTHTILFHDQTDENDGDRSKQREGWPAGHEEAPRPRSIGRAILELARAGRQTREEPVPERNGERN
jgi:small conductance mechanosensitive channel